MSKKSGTFLIGYAIPSTNNVISSSRQAVIGSSHQQFCAKEKTVSARNPKARETQGGGFLELIAETDNRIFSTANARHFTLLGGRGEDAFLPSRGYAEEFVVSLICPDEPFLLLLQGVDN